MAKVLVTGGAGFIGSHIVEHLSAEGYEPVVLDNLSSGSPSNLPSGVRLHVADIVNREQVEAVFAEERPDYVIHQAAQTSVAVSVQDPLHDALVNVIGAVTVADAAQRYGVQKVVYASSAAVYGDHMGTLAESLVAKPKAFYGVSKLTFEHYLRVFHGLHGLRYTALRYANVYGPRQAAELEGGVIAIFTKRVLAGEAPYIHGDGRQTRDFVYVGDVAAANVRALSAGDGLVLNVSSGVRTSIRDLANLIVNLAEVPLTPVFGPARQGDIFDSCLEPGAAAEALQWHARVPLAQGLKATLRYYHEHATA